jgi:hypothetical protein
MLPYYEKKNHANMCHNYEAVILQILLLTRARWPQPIALLHRGQGCIDPNISRIQFYPPSCKQHFLLANLGLDTESSIPPPKIFSVAPLSRGKNWDAVLAFILCFGHEDFIETKSVLKIIERAWT